MYRSLYTTPGVVTLRSSNLTTDDFTGGDFIYSPYHDLWVWTADDIGVKGKIWTSGDDGTTVSAQTTAVTANYVSGPHSIAVSGVAGGTAGTFVAIEGSAGATDSYTSTDGVTWTGNDAIGMVDGAEVRYCHVNGLFAIVCGGTTRQVWTSSDGLSWSNVGTWNPIIRPSQTVIDFAIQAGVWVVVSREAVTLRDFAWASFDAGVTWECVAELPTTSAAHFANAFSAVGDTFAVGYDNVGGVYVDTSLI